MNSITQKDTDRFWGKVDKEKSNTFYNGTRCWEWTGALHTQKYGHIRWNKEVCKAHRVSWEITFGKVPKDLWVLHRCDNTSCVNPSHLFLGNRQDNIDDMIAKDRNYIPKGEDHPLCKLSNIQVQEIRNRYRNGLGNQYELAQEFGVSQRLIWGIVNNVIRT